MIKKLIVALFSALVGICGAPEISMASDSVEVVGLNPVGMVETVPLPEPEPAPAPVAYVMPTVYE